MKEERRRSVRVTKPRFVEYCLRSGGVRRWLKSPIKNLSDRGICIVADMPAGRRRAVLLRLKIPARPSRTLLLEGTIVAEERKTVGREAIHIRLKRINERAKALLREYIAWVLVNERGA